MLMRVAYNLFILLSIAYLPWPSVVLFVVAGFFLYDNYLEGVLWAALVDAASGGILEGAYLYTAGSVIAYLVIARVKKHIQWYE